MNKFKVGDKVVFNQDYDRVKKGDKGVVFAVGEENTIYGDDDINLLYIKLDKGGDTSAYSYRLDSFSELSDVKWWVDVKGMSIEERGEVIDALINADPSVHCATTYCKTDDRVVVLVKFREQINGYVESDLPYLITEEKLAEVKLVVKKSYTFEAVQLTESEKQLDKVMTQIEEAMKEAERLRELIKSEKGE